MELEEFLLEVMRKQKADRSPYVPRTYFKHIPNYEELIDIGRRKGLLAKYKRNAIGLTRDGYNLAVAFKMKKVTS